MIPDFIRKIKTLNRRQRKFLQFLSLVGFIFCFIGAIYAFSIYRNAAPSPGLPKPPVVANKVSSSTSEKSAIATQLDQKNNQNCGSPSGGPTDNPIANQYGNKAYPWTNQIKWDCVYNIQDFSGATMGDRFQAARDQAAGGGVIYFPAGTYTFKDNIYLTDGVVLRGETPAVNDAKSNDYSPPSQLVFPKYEPRLSGNGTPNETAFKKIFTTEGDRDSNLGLINLDINRAAISIIGNSETGTNKNIIVFGIRSNNVAQPDPNVPDLSFQAPWMRYSDRFGSNIKLQAKENILVANNRINDRPTDNYQQPGYQVQSGDKKSVVTYQDGSKVPFNYTDHYGIVVNRSKAGGFALAATPNSEPGLFRKGLVIRDNWVYHTMRVGIHASGDGLIIQDNQIKDNPRKQSWVHPTGLREPRGANTFENRAIDWSGWNVRIEGNQYQVYRHRIQESKYFSTDGEGILIQECCGGTKVNGASIKNNQGNAYIGFYKNQDLKNVTIQGNQVFNSATNRTPLIFVMADTNNRKYQMEDVLVENNTVEGSILVKASAGGQRNFIKNNQGNNSGAIEASCHVKVTANSGFEEKPCLQ